MFGPLFGKELLEMARRRRYFLVRVLIGAALLLGWWAALQGQTPTVAYKNVAALSAVGGGLFRAWAFWSLWGVVVLTPMLVCGLIAAEKDGRTFDTLLTTLLTNREILVGKAASRLLLCLILITSSVPILAVASLYGGFDVAQVAVAAAVIAGTCLFIVVVALYYSAITFKPYIALLRTYFFLAVLWWLVPITFKSLGIPELLSPWAILDQAVSNNSVRAPLRGQSLLTGPGFFRRPAAPAPLLFQASSLSLSSNALFYAAVGALLFGRTSHLLRKRLQPGKPPWILRTATTVYRGLVSEARGSVEKRKDWAGFSGLWAAENASERWWRRGLERAMERNPLRYRNAVANAFDPERFVAGLQLIVALGTVAAFLLLAWQERWGLSVDRQLERIGLWALVGSAMLFLACSTILAASALARERQYGSWEVLMLADLTPWQHLSASVLGVLGTLRLLLAVVVMLAFVVGYVWGGLSATLAWVATMAAVWLLCVVHALFASLSHQRIAGALAATVGGLAVVLVGPSTGVPVALEWLPASLLAVGVAFWLASRRRMRWSRFFLVTAVASAVLIRIVTALGDRDDLYALADQMIAWREQYAWRARPRPSSPVWNLFFLPLAWGRRLAYGLTDPLPDLRPLIAFLLAAGLNAGCFLASFRGLATAEPDESASRGGRRRATPVKV